MAKEKIFAARMKEYNKARGNLRRNTIVMGRHYQAGNATKGQPFVPSPIVIISKEEAAELLKVDSKGRPVYRQPGRNEYASVFDVFAVDDPKELMELASKEADQRAAKGASAARAIISGIVAPVLSNEPMPELEIQMKQEVPEISEPPKQQIAAVEETGEAEEVDPFASQTEVEGVDEDPLGDESESEEKKEEESDKKKTPKPKAGSKAKKKTGRSGSRK